MHQNALVAPSHSTPEIKHVGILRKLSCKFLQNRCVIPIHETCQFCELRVWIRYSPLLFFFVLAQNSSLRSTSAMQLSQRELLDLADRCKKSHVVIEFPSVYSAPDVKECKSTAGSGVHLYSKFPPSQLLFSTSMCIELNFQKQQIDICGSRYWYEYTCFFIYLENIFLSWIIVYLSGYIWVCLPITIENNLTHFINTIFSVSSLELELSFQVAV